MEKLIVGFIYKEEEFFECAKKSLIKRFEKTDFESQTIPFIFTQYYEREFGKNLIRKFISFKRLVRQEDLPKIKLFTRRIEKKFSRKNRRLVNIDPGILSLSKLILATTKDYCHRIYIGKGIFLEVTLFYEKNTFHPLPWTYPDYKTEQYIEIFNCIRKIYKEQLNHSEGLNYIWRKS